MQVLALYAGVLHLSKDGLKALIAFNLGSIPTRHDIWRGGQKRL